MKCPKCSANDTKVIESRDVGAGGSIRRRRQCLKCQSRFTTYERIERPNLVVVKKDGTRQIYNRDKLIGGVDKAAEKTSITAEQRQEIVANVERAIFEGSESEVNSSHIGELVMNQLSKFDEVAYVRFASVYRHFTSIEGFERELNKLKQKAKMGQ